MRKEEDLLVSGITLASLNDGSTQQLFELRSLINIQQIVWTYISAISIQMGWKKPLLLMDPMKNNPSGIQNNDGEFYTWKNLLITL